MYQMVYLLINQQQGLPLTSLIQNSNNSLQVLRFSLIAKLIQALLTYQMIPRCQFLNRWILVKTQTIIQGYHKMSMVLSDGSVIPKSFSPHGPMTSAYGECYLRM